MPNKNPPHSGALNLRAALEFGLLPRVNVSFVLRALTTESQLSPTSHVSRRSRRNASVLSGLHLIERIHVLRVLYQIPCTRQPADPMCPHVHSTADPMARMTECRRKLVKLCWYTRPVFAEPLDSLISHNPSVIFSNQGIRKYSKAF
ncbi:hypothetical protein HPP92_001403 [Vanilla planifolia]|uniref:Uncharacterized protein n=1 Tax=Vanilla planifolia TaxID=51239 RepID=A0A835S458_VANPL|nr:hypothetical protein HPP92_001403 [Vanilla planifolia]